MLIQVLEHLGCHEIQVKKNEIRCSLPDGDNPTSCQIKFTDNITCNIYSRSEYGSIIDLVMYVKKISINKAVDWLCNEVGIDNDYVPGEDCETYKYLKQFIKKPKIEEVKYKTLDETILRKYRKSPIREWIEEGISEDVLQKYQVMYDLSANRIVFPIRDEEGNLINVKGRTLFPNWRELGIRKYTYYFQLGKNNTLFALNFNKQNIKDKKEVIIFEGEKSCMKAESVGINNTVAVYTHSISPQQRIKLIQLGVNIVLAYDKDVKYKEIMKDVNLLKPYTNVSYIWDKHNLLDEKDSPIDKGLDIFLRLYNERVIC